MKPTDEAERPEQRRVFLFEDPDFLPAGKFMAELWLKDDQLTIAYKDNGVWGPPVLGKEVPG